MRKLANRLLFAQAMDVLTFSAFFLLVHESVHTERNPLIAVIFAIGGFGLVGILKMGYVALVASHASKYDAGPESEFVGWKYRQPIRSRPSSGVVIALSIATASGIAGAGFNLFSLIDSLN